MKVALAEKSFNMGAPRQKAAFDIVLAARKVYRKAYIAEEPDGTTNRAHAAMAEEIGMDNTWADTLTRFAEGKLPNYTTDEFHKADAKLNANYRKALARVAGCEGDVCLTSDQLRQIERTWLVYRDAWVAYAALRWPSTSADSWRAWLTLERAQDLSGIS